MPASIIARRAAGILAPVMISITAATLEDLTFDYANWFRSYTSFQPNYTGEILLDSEEERREE